MVNRRAKSPAALERQRLRVESIVAAVRVADPSLDPAVVVSAVDQVATAPNSLARLADYLHQHPDSLCSGASASPKVVAALIKQLVATGSTVLVIPRCPDCNRAVELLHTRGPDERICSACWHRARTVKCADCGQIRPVAQRLPDGGARCAVCRSRAHLEHCGGCGRLKQVARRATDGTARCSTCIRNDASTWRVCARCARNRPVNARDADGNPLCATCYDQPEHPCDDCGQVATVASRRGGRVLCYRCYRHPKRVCGGCGRTRRVAVTGRDGQPDLCPTCHQAPILVCGVCGIEDRCRTTTPDRSPICFRCQLHRQLHQLLAGPDGTIASALLPLRDAIAGVEQPRTAIGWLARSPAIPVLTAIARGEQRLAHATLDTAAGAQRGRAFAIEHLRQLLIGCGALPERDHNLVRLERALSDLIATTHPDDQKLLRTYGTWRLLARLRSRSAQGQRTQAAACRARDVIAEATGFLAWLREHDATLATCTQAQLDQWFSQRSGARLLLPSFLRWAADRRLFPGLEIPPARQDDPKHFLGHDDRWAIARRVLTDDQLCAQDRVAAALVLLYAQPLTKIAHLTRSDVHIQAQQVRLRLGRDEITLPPPLDELIQRLPQRPPTGIAKSLAEADPWLFPGRRPGRPASPYQIARRLQDLGITTARAARNTALLQLAAELPTTVLADLLGLHPGTAERWGAAADARWTRYAAIPH